VLDQILDRAQFQRFAIELLTKLECQQLHGVAEWIALAQLGEIAHEIAEFALGARGIERFGRWEDAMQWGQPLVELHGGAGRFAGRCRAPQRHVAPVLPGPLLLCHHPSTPSRIGRVPCVTALQQSRSLRCGILLLFLVGGWSACDKAKRSISAAFRCKHLNLGTFVECG